jgi:hypothetical protein
VTTRAPPGFLLGRSNCRGMPRGRGCQTCRERAGRAQGVRAGCAGLTQSIQPVAELAPLVLRSRSLETLPLHHVHFLLRNSAQKTSSSHLSDELAPSVQHRLVWQGPRSRGPTHGFPRAHVPRARSAPLESWTLISARVTRYAPSRCARRLRPSRSFPPSSRVPCLNLKSGPAPSPLKSSLPPLSLSLRIPPTPASASAGHGQEDCAQSFPCRI